MAMIQMNHMHLLQTLFRHHAIDLKVSDLMVITTVTTLLQFVVILPQRGQDLAGKPTRNSAGETFGGPGQAGISSRKKPDF